jgi:glutathione S-transferase
LIWTSPEERDEISIEVFRRKTVETWSILEAHLFDRDYVTGSSFNMADIPLGVSRFTPQPGNTTVLTTNG